MKEFLSASARAVERLSAALGQAAAWCVLAACIVSCANTLLRYGLHFARPMLLDLPVFVFALIVLGAAPFVLSQDGHIRVDILWRRLSPRRRAIVDIAGNVLFLIPLCCVMIAQGTPFFLASWRLGEGAPTPGGLPLWMMKGLIPLAFVVLLLQALSSLARSAAVAAGLELAEAANTQPLPRDG
jgi:TRAP-type mannitol/chloroaromatic compound transport system permease small subunit